MKVVAIATIADAVPLTGENRVFAKLGLEGLRSPVNPGLKALLEVAQLSQAARLLPAKSHSASRRASTPPDAWTWPATSSNSSA